MTEIEKEVSSISTELLECQLSEDSMQVAVTVAGYVAKKLSKRSKCDICPNMMIAKDEDIMHNEYLKILSRGGLTCPNPFLSEFVCHAFSILDFISPIVLKYSSIPTRNLSERILSKLFDTANFTCQDHQDWGKKFALRIIVNIFYNNQQKASNDSVRKDQIKEFKQRQINK